MEKERHKDSHFCILTFVRGYALATDKMGVTCTLYVIGAVCVCVCVWLLRGGERDKYCMSFLNYMHAGHWAAML